jgi:protein-S-isoprenylcysteine O-methyltransferase Ste14
MNTETVTNNQNNSTQLILRRILQLLFFLALMGAILFTTAGKINWLHGWIFLGSYLILLVANALIMLPRNSDLIKERGQKKENVKGWDEILVKLNTFIIMFGSLLVAGLDERFGWTGNLPWLALAAGLLLLAVGYAISSWAMQTNRFFATYVRIQTDRGHQVIDSGPYALVRHPGYVGIILSTLAAPLVLDSLWVFVPAALSLAIMVTRTALEDRTLQAELPGYKAYAGRVRYRLLPGIW